MTSMTLTDMTTRRGRGERSTPAFIAFNLIGIGAFVAYLFLI